MIKDPPAKEQEMQETTVPSLIQEDPLQEEMATHSSILAWKIPWTDKLGGLQWGRKESDMTEHAPSQSLIKWLSNSVQFSRSVVSDSLQPHESQHTRPPCPSPTPGVHSDSRPSSQ